MSHNQQHAIGINSGNGQAVQHSYYEDDSHSTYLNKHQFNAFFNKIGIQLSEHDLDKNFRFYDRNNDGKVSSAELRSHLHINKYGLHGPRETSVRAIFDKYSQDKGYMTGRDVQAFYQSIGSPMSDEQLILQKKYTGIQGDRIDYPTFQKFVRLG